MTPRPDPVQPEILLAGGDAVGVLYDQAGVAFLESDVNGRVMALNRSLLALCGHPPEDLLGVCWTFLLLRPAAQAQLALSLWPALRASGRLSRLRIQLRRADETLVTVLLNAVLLGSAEGGRVRYTMTLMPDCPAD